jgi:hypothetical protein
MSSDETPHVPARRERREAVREKAAAVQARQRRARVIRTGVVATVVGVLVVGAGLTVAWTLTSDASQPELAPAGMQDDAIVIDTISASVKASFSGGGADAPAALSTEQAPTAEAEDSAAPSPTPGRLTIDVYVDYLSESSAQFQLANAQQLTEWVSEGAATISYHPVALLTAKSNGTKYSLRAAAAAACVATHSPDTFFAFNHELLAEQPEIDTDGYSDEELATLARATGADNAKLVSTCIQEGSFVPWVQQATARALSAPLGDTEATLTGPTVLVDGSPFVGDLADQKEFAQFVLTLASDAYYSTPTPTPTPSPTATTEPSPAS